MADFGTLGEARVAIVGDLKPLSRDFKRAERTTKAASSRMAGSMGKFEGSLKSTLLSATALTVGLAGLGAGFLIAGTIRDAISTSREFNKALSNLSAITGAAGDDLKFFADQAQSIGRPLGQAATDTVTAFKLVASAKPELLANSEALAEVTKQALILSAASGLDLPSAAKAATTALNQFGAGADQASRFINVLAAGSQLGAAEIPAFTTALTKAGTVAADAGISFELFNATIQKLAAFGTPIEQIGTSFRNTVLKMQSGADETNPAVVGLTAALGNLSKQGLSTAQITKLFGLENVVVAKQMLQTSKQAESLAVALTGTNTAVEQAETNLDNLDGDLKKLTATFDALKLAVASNEGALRGITQTGTSALEAIVENFEELSEIALNTGIVIGGVFAGRAASSLTTFVASQNKAIAVSLRRITVEEDLARKAVKVAEANELGARNNVILARDADKGTGSLGKQRTAAVALGKANRVTRAAQTRLSTAIRATSVAARTGTIAMTGLSRSMAFFGGPIGLAITGLSIAFAVLGSRADRATPKIKGLVDQIKEATAEAKSAATGQVEAFNTQIDALEASLVKLGEKRDELEAKLASPIEGGGFSFGEADTPEISRAADEQGFDRLEKKIADTRDTIAESRAEVVKLEAALKALNDTAESGGGGGGGGVSELTTEQQQAIQNVKDFIKSVEDETRVLAEDGAAREELAAVIRAENILKKEGLTLGKELEADVRAAIQSRETAKKAEEDLTEAQTEAKDLIRDTKTALELKNEAIAKANELLPILTKELGNVAAAEEVVSRAIQQANEDFQDQQEEVETTADTIEDELTSSLRSNIETWQDLKEAALDAIKNILLSLFELDSTQKGLGDFFKGLFGSGAINTSPVSTSAALSDIGRFPGLAGGGQATAGNPFVVGEQGEEIFVPDVSGTVLSNRVSRQLLGTPSGEPGGNKLEVHFHGPTDGDTVKRSLPQLGRTGREFLGSGGIR